MNGQEAFRRLAQQLQKAGGSGGGGTPGSRGFFAGGGLLVALIGGGVLLNASLFNGTPDCARTGNSAFSFSFAVDGGHRAIKYTRYESLHSLPSTAHLSS